MNKDESRYERQRRLAKIRYQRWKNKKTPEQLQYINSRKHEQLKKRLETSPTRFSLHKVKRAKSNRKYYINRMARRNTTLSTQTIIDKSIIDGNSIIEHNGGTTVGINLKQPVFTHDPLISIKLEVEEPPSEINTSLNSTKSISDTAVPETLNQDQDSEIQIKIEKEVDYSQINESLVAINNVSEQNEIDPLSPIKEEIEEEPFRIVENSILLSNTEFIKNSKENQDFQISDNNNVLQEDERGFDGRLRKRKRSEEHIKKNDCDKCKKLKSKSDFYKKEYLFMKEKCSQILERVKRHTDAIEATIKNDKHRTTEALQALLNEKHELVEKSNESHLKLLKQIETLKAELYIYKFQHCSLRILKN